MGVGKVGADKRKMTREKVHQRSGVGLTQMKFKKESIGLGLEVGPNSLMVLMPLLKPKSR